MTKYLFLDIDYTLYSPKAGCVPPSALEAIAEARRNGHKVFLCTALTALSICRRDKHFSINSLRLLK